MGERRKARERALQILFRARVQPRRPARRSSASTGRASGPPRPIATYADLARPRRILGTAGRDRPGLIQARLEELAAWPGWAVDRPQHPAPRRRTRCSRRRPWSPAIVINEAIEIARALQRRGVGRVRQRRPRRRPRGSPGRRPPNPADRRAKDHDRKHEAEHTPAPRRARSPRLKK
ncbi:MAG: hypothetical protein M0C28_00710 [Candidatus Moduliflexus flocculans]|nr:hypothetical protein [Candidatus Moduliflexus flocculans]